jgi:hydroxymethylglutaryl-CoA lyase
MSDAVTIIEVGPRDGLQNEAIPIPTAAKAEFVRDLAAAGLKEIEVSSFVSPKWVPQLGDAAELAEQLRDLDSQVALSYLVPNRTGLDRALEAGVTRIALFTAASDAFTQKNVNATVAETLERFAEVIAAFRSAVPHGFVRGYVSTIVECPIAGRVAPAAVAEMVAQLRDLGVDEISLGETLGVAIPPEIEVVADSVAACFPMEKTAWHFHDTRGTAIANVAAMLARGYRRFDSSAAGLGGCPYAKGAGGNLATDDLAYLAERMGLTTGIDRAQLAQASRPVLAALNRTPFAKAQLAALADGT